MSRALDLQDLFQRELVSVVLVIAESEGERRESGKVRERREEPISDVS